MVNAFFLLLGCFGSKGKLEMFFFNFCIMIHKSKKVYVIGVLYSLQGHSYDKALRVLKKLKSFSNLTGCNQRKILIFYCRVLLNIVPVYVLYESL